MNLIIAGVTALGSAASLWVLSFSGMATSSAASTSDVLNAAAMLGFDGASLAGVGVEGLEVGVVLDELFERYAQYQTLQDDMTILAGYKAELSIAQASLRADAADAAALAQQDAMLAQIGQIEPQIATARTDLYASIFVGVAAQDAVQRVYLDLHGASMLPVAYRFAPESYEDSAKLAWALQSERVASARGHDVPSEAAAAISAADGQVDVQAALLAVQHHGAANAAALGAWQAD